jgi:hypothetical protein
MGRFPGIVTVLRLVGLREAFRRRWQVRLEVRCGRWSIASPDGGARKLDLLRTAPKPLLLTASGGP